MRQLYFHGMRHRTTPQSDVLPPSRGTRARRASRTDEPCRPWDGQRKRQRSAVSWVRAVHAPSSFATRWPTSRHLSTRTTGLRVAQVKSTASRSPPRAQQPAQRDCKPKLSRWTPRPRRPHLPCGQRSGCARPRVAPHSCAARSESSASSRSLSTRRSPGYSTVRRTITGAGAAALGRCHPRPARRAIDLASGACDGASLRVSVRRRERVHGCMRPRGVDRPRTHSVLLLYMCIHSVLLLSICSMLRT